MSKHRFAILLLAVILANIAVWAPLSLATRISAFGQLNLLAEVRHEIIQQFVEEPDEEKMMESAVRGMVRALKDPFTTYLSKEDLKSFDKQVRGTFSGIGAEIDVHQNHLRIVSPLEGLPAWKAGVMPGDIVLEIDGVSTEGITVTQAIDKLTGTEGTQVTLKIRHDTGTEETITITRARIDVPTVKSMRRANDGKWDYMLDPQHHVGYIRITQFTDSTAERVRLALEQLKTMNAKGLIIDVRFNPGGLLESAVEISDMFLEPGKTIVSIKGRSVRERIHRSTSDTIMSDIPIVIIANEASASASEIVTGALADNDRAKFVGSRTFGKGSVQQVRMLESGLGAIKITNALYYLPSGRSIHRKEESEVWGVDPEDGFYVPMNREQIKKMVEVRRESDILRPHDANGEQPSITPEWIEQNMADRQLAAGLRTLVSKITSGEWEKVGQSGADELSRQLRRETLTSQRDLLKDRLNEVEKALVKLDAGEHVDVDAVLSGDTDEMDDAEQAEPETDPLPMPPHDPKQMPAEIIPEKPVQQDQPVEQEQLEEQLEPVK